MLYTRGLAVYTGKNDRTVSGWSGNKTNDYATAKNFISSFLYYLAWLCIAIRMMTIRIATKTTKNSSHLLTKVGKTPLGAR